MKIVINIPEETYEALVINQYCGSKSNLENIIVNGIPLPEHHGRLIDADYLREDFKTSKKISFAERMDISCIVDHAPTIIEGSDNK